MKLISHSRTLLATALLLVAAHAPAAMAQTAERILKVTVDRAKVVRISRAAETIVIGNPGIVDATLQDARTLILTGRSFGVTNLIVMDAEGDPVVDETIVVQGHETNTVRIYRRAVRETLACSPICQPTLTIGDDANRFNVAQSQINARNQLSLRSAPRQ